MIRFRWIGLPWLLALMAATPTGPVCRGEPGAPSLEQAVDGQADLILREVEILRPEVLPGEVLQVGLRFVALAPRAEPVWIGALLEGDRTVPLGPEGTDRYRLERSGLAVGEELFLVTRWPLPSRLWPGEYRFRFGLFARPESADAATLPRTVTVEPLVRVPPVVSPSTLEAARVEEVLGSGRRFGRSALASGSQGVRLTLEPEQPGRELRLLLTAEGVESIQQGEVIGRLTVELADRADLDRPLRVGVHVSDRHLQSRGARHRRADPGLELTDGGWSYRCRIRLPRGSRVQALRLVSGSGEILIELLDAVIR